MDIQLLVKQCQAGDRKAQGVLYENYLMPMRKVVSNYVSDKSAVWDILHDGFIIAFSSISTLKQENRLEPWLTTIMRNLAVRYLRENSGKTSAPLFEIPDSEAADFSVEPDLTWTDLEKIIGCLPDGYGKVFRLAVLDGLSHKEIGVMLGIAPKSSSSQLFHAKALLRRMIRQYRVEMGILSVMVIMVAIWNLIPDSGRTQQQKVVLDSNNNEGKVNRSVRNIAEEQSIDSGNIDVPAKPDCVIPVSHKQVDSQQIAVVNVPSDTVLSEETHNITEETEHPALPSDITEDDFVSPVKISARQSGSDWSLSLAYSGISGHDNTSIYHIPLSGDPNNNPGMNVEVTEKMHHHIPVVIGLSLSKSLTPRWSLETGLRYTLTESDYYSSSKYGERNVNQRIQYIGVPLKVNFRIVKAGGFSLYWHGGGSLDIPLSGRQSEWATWEPSSETKRTHIYAPLQWSVETGLGVQYNILSGFSIFAEPSVYYYFNPGGEIKTIRQDKPFEFALPIGLRFTW